MKTKNLIILSFAITAMTSQTLQASDAFFPNDTLVFNLIPGPIDDWGNHGPHHAPANISLPTVVYDEGSLLFIGTGAASFTYEILDETDEICLSGEFELIAEQEIPVSLSTLPAGDYTLLLGIAGREYEGEFTIED